MDPALLRTFNVAKGDILCATPFHKQQYVAAGTSTGTVMLFPNSSNLRYRRLVGHRGPVTCLSVSRSPEYLATGSDDATVRLWRVQGTDETCLTLDPSDGPIKSLALSANADRLIVTGKMQNPSLWDPFDQSVIQTFERHTESINAVAVNTETSIAVTACVDGGVRLFDIRSGSEVRKIDTFSAINAISLAADGNKLAVGTASGNIMTCDLGLGHILMSSRVHSGEVRAVSIHPSGQFVVSGGDDTSVIITSGDSLEPLYTLTVHKDRVVDVRFSSDGETFTSCGDDHRVMYWASPDPNAKPEEEEVLSDANEEEDEVPVAKEPPVPQPEEQTSVVQDDSINISAYLQSPSPLKITTSAKESRTQASMSQTMSAATKPSTSLSTESSDEMVITPRKSKRTKTIISVIQGPPSPTKGGEEGKFMEMLADASAQIEEIGRQLYKMGQHMQQVDEKIKQLEQVHASRSTSRASTRRSVRSIRH